MKGEGMKDREAGGEENKGDDEAETYRWRKRGGPLYEHSDDHIVCIICGVYAVCQRRQAEITQRELQ